MYIRHAAHFHAVDIFGLNLKDKELILHERLEIVDARIISRVDVIRKIRQQISETRDKRSRCIRQEQCLYIILNDIHAVNEDRAAPRLIIPRQTSDVFPIILVHFRFISSIAFFKLPMLSTLRLV